MNSLMFRLAGIWHILPAVVRHVRGVVKPFGKVPSVYLLAHLMIDTAQDQPSIKIRSAVLQELRSRGLNVTVHRKEATDEPQTR